jgi:hypothetical protein
MVIVPIFCLRHHCCWTYYKPKMTKRPNLQLRSQEQTYNFPPTTLASTIHLYHMIFILCGIVMPHIM